MNNISVRVSVFVYCFLNNVVELVKYICKYILPFANFDIYIYIYITYMDDTRI